MATQIPTLTPIDPFPTRALPQDRFDATVKTNMDQLEQMIDELNTYFITAVNAISTQTAADATTCTQKASAAATSATNAANSATAAANSASTASTKASEASGSASTASTKASQASTSATNAANSATAAANSATAAADSATSASGSASTATSKASAAATSATNAANSASAASTSATNAANSASSASGSATTATNKANAASTSATNAANSATAANQAKEAALAAQQAAEAADQHASTLVDITIATTSKAGLVKPDGSTISIDSSGLISAIAVPWNGVTSKPSSFTPSSHTHGNIANAGLLGTASRALMTDGDKKITVSSVTSTELGYLSGVTSAIQTQLNGKAASSHGTHVTFSTTAPAANGTASVGSATTVARSDHVHPLQTSVSGSSGSCTGNAATASAVAWSGVTSKPTTLSGYGITDAKIANGVITLGSNSITPLTSHQSLANYLTKLTNVSEMGRYIDLHYDNDTAKYDYDVRVCANSQGDAAGRGICDIYANEVRFNAYSQNQIRLVHGNYGVIFRNDGSNFYLLKTASGSAADGSWDSTRPLTVNLSNGVCNINGNAATATTASACSGNAATATCAASLGKSGAASNGMKFYWSGQSGQPTWLWGGSDGTNMYVYNPSNFSVANAATATKLATARSIALGTDFQGSANFDGSGNITIGASPYASIVSVGNTNNYPFHCIGKIGPITTTYQDAGIKLLVARQNIGGGEGIVNIQFRTNNTNQDGQCSVRWLVRDSELPVDCIQVGFYKTWGGIYADIFYKSAATYNSCVIRSLGDGTRSTIERRFTLQNSTEVNNTTTSSAGSSTNSYATIAAAGTALHSKAYTDTITATDAGVVASAASATTAGTCSGNAATATQFSANKSVTLTGDVTGTASSKAGWSVATTLANSGVTAGSYGPSANATPGYGATFNVPYITVDAKGRVTACSTKTVKIPASDNTNTTYTFATGSTNGTFNVTPSGGSAQAVAIKGLGTAAYTESTAYAAASHTHSYLPLSGGTLTGTHYINGAQIRVSDNGGEIQLYGCTTGNYYPSLKIHGLNSSTNVNGTSRKGVIEILAGDSTASSSTYICGDGIETNKKVTIINENLSVNTLNGITIKNENVDIPDTPTNAKYTQIRFLDSSDYMFGRVGSVLSTNSSNGTCLWAKTDINGTDTEKFLSITMYHASQTSTSGSNSVSYTSAARTNADVIIPNSDKATSLGVPTRLWKNMYSSTSVIVISDKREKSDIGNVPDALLDAWGNIDFKLFKFNSSVEEKVDSARMHVGVYAQDIEDICNNTNIDPKDYGFFCYDEWQASPESVDEDGNVIEEARPAGNRYGIRYEELLCTEAAYERREIARLKARLTAIENRLSIV